MKRKKIPYGTKLPIKFSMRERDLIRKHTFYDSDFAQLAVVKGDGIQVDLTLDDIEEIQGYVAAEANHCDNRKLERELDVVFDKLQFILDSFTDQDD